MYAIISTGGRQFRVEPGHLIAVDRRAEADGDAVTFDDVRFIGTDDGNWVSGSPRIAGARVTGVIEGHARGEKIRVFTKKRRKGMRRTIGHRTALTRVRITGIDTD